MFYKAHRNTASNENTDILIHLKKSVLNFFFSIWYRKDTSNMTWASSVQCNAGEQYTPKAGSCQVPPDGALLQSRAAVLHPLPLPGTLQDYRIQSFFFQLKGLTSNSLQPQLQLQLKGTLPDQCKMGCILLYTQSKKMDHWLTKGTNRWYIICMEYCLSYAWTQVLCINTFYESRGHIDFGQFERLSSLLLIQHLLHLKDVYFPHGQQHFKHEWLCLMWRQCWSPLLGWDYSCRLLSTGDTKSKAKQQQNQLTMPNSGLWIYLLTLSR